MVSSVTALRLLLASFALAFLAACSGREAAETTSTTTSTVAPVAVALTLTSVEPNGTAPPSNEVIAGVEGTLNRYIAGAVIQPLQTGAVPPELPELFTPAAAARLGAEDRASLVDEGLPRFPRIDPLVATFGVSTIADGDGLVGVVVARLDLQVRASRKKTAVDIVRQGDFVLVPDPAGWKIDSYQIHAARDTVPPTTTTAPPKGEERDE